MDFCGQEDPRLLQEHIAEIDRMYAGLIDGSIPRTFAPDDSGDILILRGHEGLMIRPTMYRLPACEECHHLAHDDDCVVCSWYKLRGRQRLDYDDIPCTSVKTDPRLVKKCTGLY